MSDLSLTNIKELSILFSIDEGHVEKVLKHVPELKSIAAANLPTINYQLEFVKRIAKKLKTNTKPNIQSECFEFIVKIFFTTPLKHPLRNACSKLIVSLNSENNDTQSILYFNLFQNICLIDHNNFKEINNLCNNIGGCIDIFPNILDKDIIKMLDFLILSLRLNVEALSNLAESLSPTKKSEFFSNIHNIFRLLILILQKYNYCNIFLNDHWKVLLPLCIHLLNHDELPLDTKINSCIILILECEHNEKGSWLKVLMYICENNNLEDFIFKENKITLLKTSISKLGIWIAVINIINSKELCNTEIEQTSAINFITSKLINMSKMSSGLNSTIILCITRGIFTISKLLFEIPDSVALEVSNNVLNFLWLHLHHYVDSVRHLTNQILNNIVKLSSLLKVRGIEELSINIMNAIFKNSKTNEYTYYTVLKSLASEYTCSYLIKHNPTLINDMIIDINAQLKSSDLQIALSAFEALMIKYKSENSNESIYNIWINPILQNLIIYESKYENAQSLMTVMMREVLFKAINLEPDIVNFIISDIFDKKSYKEILTNGELKCILICLNVAKKLGYFDNINSENKDVEKWKGVISYQLLNIGVCHQNIEITLLVFSLIVDSHKTTETFTSEEFDLIKIFFAYNVNNNIPNIKQEILSITKKFFSRWEKSYIKIKKQLSEFKTADEQKEIQSLNNFKDAYEIFLKSLITFCLQNIFPDANFSRKNIMMQILLWCQEVSLNCIDSEGIFFCVLWDNKHIKLLDEYLEDSYECNKQLAVSLLSYPTLFNKLYSNSGLWFSNYCDAIQNSSNYRPTDCISSAYKLKLLLSKKCILPYDIHYVTINILLKVLQMELQIAQKNIFEAAGNGPMHGILYCIRFILNLVDFSAILPEQLKKWRNIIQSIINTCFNINETVAPVVNNSSPEGHFPMDFNSNMSNCGNTFQLDNGIIVTSQMLLLCGWRSVKEVSLLLGDIAFKLKISDDDIKENIKKDQQNIGLIKKQNLLDIGDHFITLLSETKHRGAFEQAYVGFTKLCLRLWKCESKYLHSLPNLWLNDLIDAIASESPKSFKLCATRRSAGVPFIIQALVVTEIQVNNNQNASSFHMCMALLLNLAKDKKSSIETKTHCLNILRALYRHTMLGEHINAYISEGLIISIMGFEGATWAERNSSTLLFSSLITRIFGVQRTKDSDQLSIRNKMTGRIFFMRYPKLYDYLLDYMKANVLVKNEYIRPSLYPILLLFSRLYPSSLEGTDSNFELAAFVPYLMLCANSPVLKIRQLAAKACFLLINPEQYVTSLKRNLEILLLNTGHTNFCHGIFLQILKILHNVTKDTILTMDLSISIINCFKKYLIVFEDNLNNISPCFLLEEAYLDVLLLFIYKFKNLVNVDIDFFTFVKDNICQKLLNNKPTIFLGINQFHTKLLQLSFQLTYALHKENIVAPLLKIINDNICHDSQEVISLLMDYLICLYNIVNEDEMALKIEIGTIELNFVSQLKKEDIVEILDTLHESKWYKHCILNYCQKGVDYDYQNKALHIITSVPNGIFDCISVSKLLDIDNFFESIKKCLIHNSMKDYLKLKCIYIYLNDKNDITPESMKILNEILYNNLSIDIDEMNKLAVADFFLKHWKIFKWEADCVDNDKFSLFLHQWLMLFKLLNSEKSVSSKISRIVNLILYDADYYHINENKAREALLEILFRWLKMKCERHAIAMLIVLGMWWLPKIIPTDELQIFDKEDTVDIEEECVLTMLCMQRLKDSQSALTTENNASSFIHLIRSCNLSKEFDDALKPLFENLENKHFNNDMLDSISKYKVQVIISTLNELGININ